MAFDSLKRLFGRKGSVRVVGVVSPGGISGSRLFDEPEWTFSLSLQPWRRKGQALREQELRLRKSTSKEEVDRLMASVESRAVVELVVVLEDEAGGRGRLLELVGEERADAELTARAAALATPVVVEDETFGELTLDRTRGAFSGEATWEGRRVRLLVSCEGDGEPTEALAFGRQLWAAPSRWRGAPALAVRELLQRKNELWLAEDEEELTAEAFRSRMTLELIHIDVDGSIAFSYDDGDLFFGHTIEVTGSLEEGPRFVDTPG